MDFQKEVIERSNDIPVLVDFWAPWCGPCQYIGPVLEDLAAQQEGRWQLVKVNVDEHQDISSRYSIRGIPAIKLFVQGEVIGEFSGALPRPAVEKFLDEHIPGKEDDQLNKILEEAGSIPDENTISKLSNYLVVQPDNEKARLYLAMHQVFLQPTKVTSLLENFHLGDEDYEIAQNIREFARFMTTAYDDGKETGNLLEEARFDIMEGDFESGIEKLIEATGKDKNYQKDLPRLTAIALFHILGKDHSVTKLYRRRFDMALY